MDDTSYITKFETDNGNKDKFNRLETFSADESVLESLYISSQSSLKHLSASNLVNGLDGQLTENGSKGGGENGYAFVIMPEGGSLKSIDLSNDKLYGKNWRIGTFKFLSSVSEEKIDNFYPAVDSGVEANTEYIKGHTLSQTIYSGFRFTDIHYGRIAYEDSDGDTQYRYGWIYDIEEDIVSKSSTSTIDWWDDGWGLDLSDLRMYGNMINFRSFLGGLSITVGEAVDSGLLEEDIITFEPRTTTERVYVSNSAFSRLSTSEKNSIRQRLESNIGGSTYYGCTVTQASDGSITISDITLILVPPSSVKDIIQDYFTLTTMQVKEDITGFLETAEWRNASFVSQSRNAVTENTFSIRMGTRLWDTDGDDGAYDQNPVFVVHKKYKGHAGLGTGLLDKYSAGTLSITGVDGSSVQESTLTNIGAKYGGGTIWLGYNYDSKLTEGGSAAIGGSSGESRSSAKGQSIGDIRNKLIKFRHWDQWTQSASHNGVALIFPFGW